MTELDRLITLLKTVDDDENLEKKLQVLGHRFRIPAFVSMQSFLLHLAALNVIEDVMPMREASDFTKILNLYYGNRFWYDGEECVFVAHFGKPQTVELPPNGYFEYRDEQGRMRGLDYDVAWSALTDGKLIL